mgnify:CR=1 FL=1
MCTFELTPRIRAYNSSMVRKKLDESAGGRHLVTVSLPPNMVEEIRVRCGEEPLSASIRKLVASALNQSERAEADLHRLAELAACARSLKQSPTTKAYANILCGLARDILRQVPDMPRNPDWKELMTFISTFSSNTSIPSKPLAWRQGPSSWRQEWMAGLDNEGSYGVAEQPHRDPNMRMWSTHFYDHKGNIYGVDGEVFADSLEEAKAACERDAADRRAERRGR